MPVPGAIEVTSRGVGLYAATAVGTVARTDGHTMRKVREISSPSLRAQAHPQRQISASTGVSKGAVSDHLKRAHEAGLTWGG